MRLINARTCHMSGRKRGCLDTSDIADTFSSTFINPTFRFSPNSILKYETLDYKNPRFQTSVFSIFACSQIRKLGYLKSEIFKHPSFQYSPAVKYQNLDFRKIRDLQTSVFSIFAYSQIRNLGCLKSEILKHPSF